MKGIARALPTVLAVLAGAAAGLVVSLQVRPSATAVASAAPTVSSPPAVAQPGQAPSGARFAEQRLRALEQRVEELQQGAIASASALAPPPAAPTDFREARKRANERAYEAFTARLAEIQREARAPAWAARQERELTARFTSLREGADGGPPLSFSLLSLDCRSTTCIAQLRWDGWGQATGEMEALLRGAEAGCAREIFLPPQDKGSDQPVEAAMILDCEGPDGGEPR